MKRFILSWGSYIGLMHNREAMIPARQLGDGSRQGRRGGMAFLSWLIPMIALLVAPSVRANLPGGGNVGPSVVLTDGGATATIDNGIIRAKIDKASAEVSSLIYKGKEMIDPKGLYWSMDGGTSYQNPSNCVYSVTVNSTAMVDVACKHSYVSTDPHAVDIEVHYVLRQGATGLYVYAILDHPASYPAFDDGEWRMVWSMPGDPAHPDNFLLEKVYADSLRHWKAPTKLDLQNGTTTGIKEIQLLNTGERAGQYECKYEYALEYYKVGTYGWASDVYNIGGWIVLGNYEYFNDGPPKQDLGPAPNGGGMLLHFGRNHFNGSGLSIPAGQSWSKIYGPFFLYFNTNPAGGDACWLDAQNQVAAEHSAWPYSWLDNKLYPQNPARGTVTGHLTINDPLKPSQSAAGAWIGVTDAPPNTNWQMWGQGYQYWVQADANGNFVIPAVRPGQLTLSAYVTGEVGEFTQTNVLVTANATTALGNMVWNVNHPGKSIAWEIGVPDRRTEEFAEGSTSYYLPYEYQTLYKKFPNPLTYTVGTSNPAKDFPYVQSALWQPNGNPVAWPWHINFNLASVPSSGNATLTLAFAGANTGSVNVSINDDTSVFSHVTPSVSGGNGLLREVNHAKYCVEYVTIPVSRLKVGANTITLVQPSLSGDGNHVMYDYLNLELPTAAPPPVTDPSARLTNISTRSFVGTGGDVQIAGFIIGGTTPEKLVIRASGPALSKYGVSGFLTDPVMEVHQNGSSQVLATSDDWDAATLRPTFQQLGIDNWETGSKDAAVFVTLNPGAYTAVVSGKNNTTGTALIEAFEVESSGTAKLTNISTRSVVKTNGDVQIAGFIISGNGPKKVVIRASGPALSKYNVPGVLADPVLEIHQNGVDAVLATNDDWIPADVRPTFQLLGIDNWDIGSKDAALVLTLNPGGYTAVVSGKNNTTGVALIEVFEVP